MPLSAPRFSGIPRLEEVAANDPVMRYGETGLPVQVIQQALVDFGIPMPISTSKGGPDGIFLSETRSAVKAFQRAKPGPIRDDGIVGKDTMAKLDAHFRSTGPAGPLPPPPPTTRPTVPPLPETPLARQEEIIRQLVEDAKLPRQKAEEIAKALMGINVARHAVVLGQIVEIFSAAGAVAAAASVVGALGFIAGSMIALVNAMESSIRISGSLGYVYGYTAWTFGEKRPDFSKTLETNLSTPMYSTSHSKAPVKHRKAWSKSVTQAFLDAPQGARKAAVKGEKLDMETYRLLLRLWGENRPSGFSYKFSHRVSANISSKIEREFFLDAVASGCIYNF